MGIIDHAREQLGPLVRQLLDDIDTMGPVKLSAVEDAQAAVVEVALRLQADGKITVAGAGGEEMV